MSQPVSHSDADDGLDSTLEDLAEVIPGEHNGISLHLKGPVLI